MRRTAALVALAIAGWVVVALAVGAAVDRSNVYQTTTTTTSTVVQAPVCSIHADGSIHIYTDPIGVEGTVTPCPEAP